MTSRCLRSSHPRNAARNICSGITPTLYRRREPGGVSDGTAFSFTTIVRRSPAAQNRPGGVCGHYVVNVLRDHDMGQQAFARRLLDRLGRRGRFHHTVVTAWAPVFGAHRVEDE